MTRAEELQKSQQIELSKDFHECLNYGILFNPRHGIEKMCYNNMSASIIIHHWNHSKFLPMLFQSFYEMDKENIDCQFIITDSGSSDSEIENILNLLESYKNKLKIDFLYHNLDELRNKFNNENQDGTFHGFPYISNSAINFCKNNVHVICDSSNIVNKNWLRGLVSPHYLFPQNNLIIKSLGGDFTPESTIQLENKDFSEEFFNLPHQYHEFQAGRGFGWSMKTEAIKSLGGFRHLLSSCGGVDDDIIYRAVKLKNFQFFGHKQSFAIHRIHDTGYRLDEGNKPRKPNWAYNQLKRLYITEKIINPIIEFESIKPIKIYKNY